MGQQTSYTQAPPLGIVGTLASIRQDQVKLARAAEGALTFGTLVVRGTDPETQVKPPAVTADITNTAMGIVVNPLDLDQDVIEDGTMCNVLRSGHIFVISANAFTAGGDVFAVDATGAIRSDATAATAIPNAKFLTSGGAGAIAEIEFDLTGQG